MNDNNDDSQSGHDSEEVVLVYKCFSFFEKENNNALRWVLAMGDLLILVQFHSIP